MRIRKGWRQDDVAREAGVSQDAVSRAERGLIATMPVERVRAIGAAIGVTLDLVPRWQGGELDRLLGLKPWLVEGSEDNSKVTTPADIALAESILKRMD